MTPCVIPFTVRSWSDGFVEMKGRVVLLRIQKRGKGGWLWMLKGLTKDVCDGLFCVLTVVVATQIYRWLSPQKHISMRACNAGVPGRGQWREQGQLPVIWHCH